MNEDNIRRRKRFIHGHYNLNIKNNNNNIEDDSCITHQHRKLEAHPNYIRKRIGELICSICEGPAYGYNFDAITCESCKAFFRRNALRSDVYIRISF